MPSAGELLRSERLKKNRTLAEIAERTRISRRYLEAIETDSTKDLPGEFFYKAFIRQYATALDLDPDTTEQIMSSALPVSDPDPVPVLSQVYERAQTADSDRWRPSTGVAVGLLVVVLAGGSLLYAWWQRAQASPEPFEPQPVTTQQPQEPPPAQPQAQADSPTAAAPAQSASTAPVAGDQTGLHLSASEPAWVQVTSGGKTLFIGTVEPNQPQQISVSEDALLRTGNAGGLQVRWNGKEVGPIGPKGQVRVLRLTPEGAEVVPPKPKAVSPGTEPNTVAPDTAQRVVSGETVPAP